MTDRARYGMNDVYLVARATSKTLCMLLTLLFRRIFVPERSVSHASFLFLCPPFVDQGNRWIPASIASDAR